ncbi:MAG: TIGR03086 family protein [Actinobacteria bacterium]|nr:TIGR03086 family protein [Actinomycetota bacterium]
MTLKPDVAFVQGLDFFSDAVGRLGPADWDRPSPCQGWRALDVLGHVGQATRFGTALLQGDRPEWAPVEPPGDLVDGAPAGWWAGLASRARDAVGGVDLDQVVDSPAGRRSVGDGLSFPALDLYIHGWDIARSGGVDLVIPAAAIEFAHSVIDPVPDGTVRNGRVFAAAKPAPAGATESEAFLAWTGRDLA